MQFCERRLGFEFVVTRAALLSTSWAPAVEYQYQVNLEHTDFYTEAAISGACHVHANNTLSAFRDEITCMSRGVQYGPHSFE